MKEFNLSEKITMSKCLKCKEFYGRRYKEEDVKEFIRLLKEELERGVKRNKVFPLDWCFDSIDKLAGPNLIEQEGGKENGK